MPTRSPALTLVFDFMVVTAIVKTCKVFFRARELPRFRIAFRLFAKMLASDREAYDGPASPVLNKQ